MSKTFRFRNVIGCEKPSFLENGVRAKLSFLEKCGYEKLSFLALRVGKKPSVLHSKPCIYAKLCTFQFITFTWFIPTLAWFYTHFYMVLYSLWHGFVIQTFAFFGKIFVVVCRICCF
nr:MAG TPA: hypothetical protein [Caudoviricetes sp.]